MSKAVIYSIIPVYSACIILAGVHGANKGSFLTSVEKNQKRVVTSIAEDDFRERRCQTPTQNINTEPFQATVYFTGRDTLGFYRDAGALIVKIRRNPKGKFDVTGHADEFDMTKRSAIKALERKVPDYKDIDIRIPGCGRHRPRWLGGLHN